MKFWGKEPKETTEDWEKWKKNSKFLPKILQFPKQQNFFSLSLMHKASHFSLSLEIDQFNLKWSNLFSGIVYSKMKSHNHGEATGLHPFAKCVCEKVGCFAFMVCVCAWQNNGPIGAKIYAKYSITNVAVSTKGAVVLCYCCKWLSHLIHNERQTQRTATGHYRRRKRRRRKKHFAPIFMIACKRNGETRVVIMI